MELWSKELQPILPGKVEIVSMGDQEFVRLDRQGGGRKHDGMSVHETDV